MISTLLTLICAAVLVAWTSSKIIRYSLELSSILHVKTFVIGFVVLSLSTSLPELSVAIISGLSNVPGLAVGNIVGSNFIDLTLILGLVVVLVGEIRLEKKDELDLITIFAIATLVMLLIFTGETLTRAQGAVLICLYVVSIFHIYSQEKLEIIVEEEEKEARAELKEEEFLTGKFGTVVKLLSTLTILIISSKLMVDSGVSVAIQLGIPLSIIGSTIVAFGTSLPELSLQFHAIRRKEYALALGDAFGSALTNTTLVLGILAMLSPAHIEVSILTYLLPLLFVALIIIWSSLLKHKKITKKSGMYLISIYLLFLFLEILQLTAFK